MTEKILNNLYQIIDEAFDFSSTPEDNQQNINDILIVEAKSEYLFNIFSEILQNNTVSNILLALKDIADKIIPANYDDIFQLSPNEAVICIPENVQIPFKIQIRCPKYIMGIRENLFDIILFNQPLVRKPKHTIGIIIDIQLLKNAIKKIIKEFPNIKINDKFDCLDEFINSIENR